MMFCRAVSHSAPRRGAPFTPYIVSRALSSGSSSGSPIPPDVPNDQKFLGLQGASFIKVAESACPFVRDTLGAKVTHLRPGELTMAMPYKSAFIGNPVTRVLHGGVTAALMDHVGGFCAMSAIEDKNYLLSTVDMRIDYLSPAPPDTIVCEACVVSVKKTLIRSDVVAWNADRTKKVAIGRTLYSKYPSKITLSDTMINMVL